MTARLIDGKKLEAEIRAELSDHVQKIVSETGVTAGLAVILVGDDAVSHVYVSNKIKVCEKVGMRSEVHRCPSDISNERLIELIEDQTNEDTVYGSLVRLPPLDHIASREVLNRLADGRIVGDVDFERVAQKASHITPVPDGVGPMTVTMLLENTYQSAKRAAHHHASSYTLSAGA